MMIAAYWLYEKTMDTDRRLNKYGGMTSVIATDPGGYYVYLPAWFIHGFEAKNYPDSIVEKSGYGISIKEGKIYTKYTSGLAMMCAPLYFLAHQLAPIMGYAQDGYTRPYQVSVRISAVIYTLIGLFFIFLTVNRYAGFVLSLMICFLSLFATNTYYYIIRAPGFTHIYSFALIACFIWLLHRISEKPSRNLYIAMAAICILIFIVRPLNIWVFMLIPLFGSSNFREVLLRIKLYAFNGWFIIASLLFAFLFFFPQLSYWKYAYGSYFYDTYQNEPFENIWSPKFYLVWFSTNNGLFIYVPLYFLAIVALGWMCYKKLPNAWVYLTLFVALSYTYASWWIPSFGCSFGQRNFLDVWPIFVIPLAVALEKIVQHQHIVKQLFAVVAIYLCYYWTYNLSIHWWYCYYGQGDYDFKEIIKYL
jgi:hypothetical protein